MDRMTARLGLGALVMAIALSAGCAEERDPINRVQPNAVSKHFFVGDDLVKPDDDPEFYWRNFVVDGSVSQSLVGVGSWGHVDRVRWEITEDYLIAHKAYQIAQGADVHGDPLGAKTFTKAPNGTVVAAYKISSHFDIKRDYNPQTGEELNIIEENTTDRPWNEREYLRIDWSTNYVDNPMWQDVFTAEAFGELTITPIAYYVNDPASDDAPHIEENTGYLDITNKFYVSPAESPTPFIDMPSLPTCLMVGLYTGSATYDCNAQEAVVRSSYSRIDPNDDFEPLENTKQNLDVIGNPGGIGDAWSVGIVTAGIQGWDPQYGYTDSLYHRFANVHNIWKKSHQDATSCDSNDDTTDEDDSGVADGTADECQNSVTNYSGARGSQCDIFVGKCTIPYRDRTLKTVSYWINKDVETTAPDLLDTVEDGNVTERGSLEDLVFSWNQLMSVAAGYAREVECRNTKDGDRDSCHAQFFQSTNDPATKQMVAYGGWLTDVPSDPRAALTFCHNPVRSYDQHDVCGDTGATARVGDVRKNFIFYWPYESRAPWGGIANWNADPLTGQIVGASATIMGRSATFAAAQQRDIIQIAVGDQKLDDIITGVPSQNYVRTLQNGYTPQALTTEEMSKRIAAIDLDNLHRSIGDDLKVGTLGKTLAIAQLQAKTVANPLFMSSQLLQFSSLVKQLSDKAGQYEAQLVDSHWLVNAFGQNPSTVIDDSTLNLVSPLRSLDPGRLSALRSLMTAGLQDKGVCYLDSEAPATGSVYLNSLGKYFLKKYPASEMGPIDRGNLIYKDLWKESVKGIGLHEVGHSLGMLHNFTSSWDSINYNPQYWQLRTNEGQAMGECTGPRSGNTDSCMGPRYLDPETPDELGTDAEPRPGIDYYGNTSTMEYQIERGGETVGLGTYDQHTMKALYGRVLETFDDRDLALDKQQNLRWKHYSQLVERDLVQEGLNIGGSHYTKTARTVNIFNPTRDCRNATDEEKAHATWRVVHGKVCAPPPKDHNAWRNFRSDSINGTDPDFISASWHTVDVDGKDRVRWPYRWGSGHNSYFHDNDSDAGADPYEVTVNTARRFALSYPWAYFRRQNREYYYETIPFSVADRYFDRVRSYHWIVANDLSLGSTGVDDDNDLKPYVMAEKEMLNLLMNAVLMPEPGNYGSIASQPVDLTKPIFDLSTSQNRFTVGIVDGRYIGEEYDNSLGGSWDYQHWIKHAGFMAEKERAIEALVDGRPTLFTISRANFLDGRNVSINFRTDMKHAVDRLVGGMLSEDWEAVAPHIVTGADPEVSPTLLSLADDSPTRPANAKILFPNTGYRQQLGTSIYTALFSRMNTDMTLSNKMRVWVDGRVDTPKIPDALQVRFTNPGTFYTYLAEKFGSDVIDGKTVDSGIGSRMLQHANALVAAAYKVQLDVNNKPVFDSYGEPTLILDAENQPQIIDADAQKTLLDYVGLLDANYQILQILGTGPL